MTPIGATRPDAICSRAIAGGVAPAAGTVASGGAAPPAQAGDPAGVCGGAGIRDAGGEVGREDVAGDAVTGLGVEDGAVDGGVATALAVVVIPIVAGGATVGATVAGAGDGEAVEPQAASTIPTRSAAAGRARRRGVVPGSGRG